MALALDVNDVNVLKKGGIKRMNHLYQYITNIETFDNYFPDNLLTMINVSYFIRHLYVHNYKKNDWELLV